EAYQAYAALLERPLGMFSLGQDGEGKYIVSARELFC
ncbi:hypothetical protein V498_05335, partial [Pseudogymnoascus sp. VKM F-4517 (FW-2822)]